LNTFKPFLITNQFKYEILKNNIDNLDNDELNELCLYIDRNTHTSLNDFVISHLYILLALQNNKDLDKSIPKKHFQDFFHNEYIPLSDYKFIIEHFTFLDNSQRIYLLEIYKSFILPEDITTEEYCFLYHLIKGIYTKEEVIDDMLKKSFTKNLSFEFQSFSYDFQAMNIEEKDFFFNVLKREILNRFN